MADSSFLSYGGRAEPSKCIIPIQASPASCGRDPTNCRTAFPSRPRQVRKHLSYKHSHTAFEYTRQLQKSIEMVLTKGGETRCFPV